MKARTGFSLALLLVAAMACAGGAFWIHRGFRARSTTTTASEASLARKIRNLRFQRPSGIPRTYSKGLREICSKPANFSSSIAHPATAWMAARAPGWAKICPRAPDLRASLTQSLSDGELHYIIENGVQLTGVPAFTDLHLDSRRGAWLLVLYVRNLATQNRAPESQQAAASPPVHFVG